MKKLTLLFFFASFAAFAQIPNGYYNSVTGTGYAMKTQLYNIIKGQNAQSYNALYTCYQTSDRDYFYENDGTILDMYSENPIATDPYNFSATSAGQRCGNYNSEGDCFNREHLMPQSVFNEQSPMVSDAHHIFPTDGKVNGARSNYAFGIVSNPTWTSMNGSKLGANSTTGYSGIVFEPIDEFKGDIARALLYFGTRYENQISGWNHAMLNGTSNQVFSSWFLNILLTWNMQDPVSDRELTRNNAVYNFQGNRNPYIDHPEYVSMIWGMPLGLEDVAFSEISVYPNPSTDHNINIHSAVELENIELFSLNGQLLQKISKPVIQDKNYAIQNLPQGLYMLRLSNGRNSVTKKVVIN